MNRFLSESECATLFTQIMAMAAGGGTTNVFIHSAWSGNLRWARNGITTCGDVRANNIGIGRSIRGASNRVLTNQIDTAALEAAVRRAERLLVLQPEDVEESVKAPATDSYSHPKLWFDQTYNLDAAARADAMGALVKPARDAGMWSAGYLAVSATGHAASLPGGRSVYYPFTSAAYSVTVRDPSGTGSGWAGMSANNWSVIDATHLSAIALDKCLRSRHPVAIEPGRYTTILEPQAVCDFVSPLFALGWPMDRYANEQQRPPLPFSGEKRGASKIGEPMLDERITISADPMDPNLGFVPFDVMSGGEPSLIVYNPVKWFEDGVLMQLSYDRFYAMRELGMDTSLQNSGAFKMSGDTTTVEEMIANTTRGLLVTRFSDIALVDQTSFLLTGYTRDGVWLIEKGKVTKAVRNLRFTDSPLFALGNVAMLGAPVRVYHPESPVMVPPITVRDFNFTGTSDAV